MDNKKKRSSAKASKPRTSANKPTRKKQGDTIFALDIGTRSVVGILGLHTPEGLKVLDIETVFHSKRSMLDGQIEDIDAVARDIVQVRKTLEKRNNIMLTKACIAAAGRALKTLRACWDYKLPPAKVLTDEDIKETELDAVRKTCGKFSEENQTTGFYCVGHSVISKSLDGFKVTNPEGHRGETLTTEIIATFLPAYVVESLCSAMEAAKLEVADITLEPIAAMNVIIPPELRITNLALCDIGAGTSDIAISSNGSVVAYAMATTAGDEVTETIMRELLVDFSTAEMIKTSTDDIVTYTDILLNENTISREEINKVTAPAAEELAKVIAREILDANIVPPKAVFLAGGGSKLKDLTTLVAKELGMPDGRVTAGRDGMFRGVLPSEKFRFGAELATPLGIAVSSGSGISYDFTTITFNGKRIRALDTSRLTVFELLNLAKFKTQSLIAPSGKTLSFILSGTKTVVRGEPAKPSEITVNGKPASLTTVVTKGDEVNVVSAQKGKDASARLSDYFNTKELSSFSVSLFGTETKAGKFIRLNGNTVTADRRIQDNDEIELISVQTLGELVKAHKISDPVLLNGNKAAADSVLHSGDVITKDENASADLSQPKKTDSIAITVNGISANYPLKSDGKLPIFLDVAAAFSDNPSEMLAHTTTVTVNGRIARLDEELHNGDVIVIE